MYLFQNHSYPPRYIYIRFNKFFSSYLPTPFVLPLITCEHDFAFIRRILLDKPTISEYQIASRIAKTIHVDSKEDVDNGLVKTGLGEQNESNTNLIIHFTHEK